MPDPNMCVVVPALNAAGTLKPALEALLAAGFEPRDIVVVDDGSTDATPNIARDFRVGLLKNPAPKGAAFSRNRGVTHIDGDLIVFVDADVVVHADVRRRLAEWYDRCPDEAAVFGSYDDDPAIQTPVSRVRNLLHHYTHQTAPATASTFWTGLGAVRRDAFQSVGGFDPNQAFMEDIAFGHAVTAAGHQIRLDKDLQGSHLKHWSLTGFMRTDLFHRAIPWSRLLKTSQAPKALNVSARGKASVVSVFLSLLSLILLPMVPSLAMGFFIASIGLVAGLNYGFLRLIYRLNGISEVAVGLLVLWLHFLMAGLGYAWVMIEDTFKKS